VLRAELTSRLVADHGFVAVAAEADWPDAYRVNSFVRGAGDDASGEEALRDFRRFPAWMWRNTVVEELVERLRAHNAGSENACGFYGLDLYSLHASMEAVVGYLEKTDPEAARRARERFACFERFRVEGDGQAYGHAAELGRAEPCEDVVVAQLLELRSRAAELAAGDGQVADERRFAAEQNARVVVGAEAYYRSVDEIRPGRPERGHRRRPDLRTYRAKRANGVAPEPDGILVGGVEGQPGERTILLRRGTPFAEHH